MPTIAEEPAIGIMQGRKLERTGHKKKGLSVIAKLTRAKIG